MISWGEAKRQAMLVHRGLDFADAWKVFDGLHFDREDDRIDYGGIRYITAGRLDGRFVVIVWTAPPGWTPHNFHEVRTCQGRVALPSLAGLIPMTRRN